MNFKRYLYLGALIFAVALHANAENLQFYSQASQDQFVYSIFYDLLGKKEKGYYLEIGAGEPIDINNTYFFEKNLHWEGVSIDISHHLVAMWHAARTNPLLSEDAIQADYSVILQSLPREIDYLSLDVDGHYDRVLERLVTANHIFKVITIEHDFYRYGDLFRSKERQILEGLGYHLLCPDVSHCGSVFEDWWIHPDFFPSDILSDLTSLDLQGKDHAEIIQAIQSHAVWKLCS